MAAAEDGYPKGRFGVGVGVRQGTGELAQDYGLGYVFSIDAGYQPTNVTSPLLFGVHWTASWSYFGTGDRSSIAGNLSTFELSGGVRIRRLVNEKSLAFVFAGGGATLLRTNVPVPPENKRDYIGAYAAGGFELFALGRNVVSLEGRYGLIGAGPGAISLTIGIAMGY